MAFSYIKFFLRVHLSIWLCSEIGFNCVVKEILLNTAEKSRESHAICQNLFWLQLLYVANGLAFKKFNLCYFFHWGEGEIVLKTVFHKGAALCFYFF